MIAFFRELRLSARLGKIQSNLMAGDYETAREHLDIVLSAKPPEHIAVIAHCQRGEVEFYAGNFEAALESLEYCTRNAEVEPKAWEGEEWQAKLIRAHKLRSKCLAKLSI